MPKNQKKIVGLFKKKKPRFVKNAKFQKKKFSKKLDGVLPAMSRLRLNNYAKKNPQVHTKTTQEKLDEELRSVWKSKNELKKYFYSQETKPLHEKKVNHNEKPSSVQNKKKESLDGKIEKKPKTKKKKESLDGKIEKKKPKTKKKEESLDGKIKKKTSSKQNMKEKTENVNKNEKPSSAIIVKKESLDGKNVKKLLKINKKKKPVSILLPPRSESRVKDKWKGKIHEIDIDEEQNTFHKLMPGGKRNDMMMMAENTTNGHLLIGGQNKRSMWVDSNYSSSSSQNNHSSSDHDTKNDYSNRWTNNHFNQEEESINENDEIIKAMNDQRMNSFLYGVNGPLGMNISSAFPGSSVRSD